MFRPGPDFRLGCLHPILQRPFWRTPVASPRGTAQIYLASPDPAPVIALRGVGSGDQPGGEDRAPCHGHATGLQVCIHHPILPSHHIAATSIRASTMAGSLRLHHCCIRRMRSTLIVNREAITLLAGLGVVRIDPVNEGLPGNDRIRMDRGRSPGGCASCSSSSISLTSKGQVIIPKALRQQLGLARGGLQVPATAEHLRLWPAASAPDRARYQWAGPPFRGGSGGRCRHPASTCGGAPQPLLAK